MSRKMMKVLILGAMVVSALVSASSASAWTANFPNSFTATAPASRLTISGQTAGINCTTTTATGTITRASGTNGTDVAADLTLAFTGCRAGGFTATVSCGTGSVGLIPDNVVSGVVTGHVISQRVSPICTILVPSIPTCRIDVTANSGLGGTAVTGGTYTDSTGVLVVPTTGQTLTATWTTCGTLFGSASSSAGATFTNSTGGSLSYRVTSTPLPDIR